MTKHFRQTDETLIKLLRDVRYNKVASNPETEAILKSRQAPLKHDKHLMPTKLFCKNLDVDKINNMAMLKLPAPEHSWNCKDSVTGAAAPFMSDSAKAQYFERYFDNKVPKVVKLRVNAQVMLARNVDTESGLVNGSRGYVEKFEYEEEEGRVVPVVKFICGQTLHVEPVKYEWEFVHEQNKAMVVREQIPLKLAWALTIHKSQGLSIDLLEVELRDVFEKGQAYVALSRARTLEGLRLLSYDVKKFWTSELVVEFYKKVTKALDDEGTFNPKVKRPRSDVIGQKTLWDFPKKCDETPLDETPLEDLTEQSPQPAKKMKINTKETKKTVKNTTLKDTVKNTTLKETVKNTEVDSVKDSQETVKYTPEETVKCTEVTDSCSIPKDASSKSVESKAKETDDSASVATEPAEEWFDELEGMEEIMNEWEMDELAALEDCDWTEIDENNQDEEFPETPPGASESDWEPLSGKLNIYEINNSVNPPLIDPNLTSGFYI
eukprot:GHVL01017589.1.p1 GENE.GHVL01017589.1~~GHVL01017589.1.p1  ORF type:complete len:493 (-),score=102.30 GHVL01017589.1:516-1994(-)